MNIVLSVLKKKKLLYILLLLLSDWCGVHCAGRANCKPKKLIRRNVNGKQNIEFYARAI